MSTYEISKSSLISLKAEILKKQEEVNKAKLENKARVPKEIKRPLEIKNKGVEKRAENECSEEEVNLLAKSRSILEQKAILYDKLAKGMSMDEDRKRRYLVHFDKKSLANRVTEQLPDFDCDGDDKRRESEEEDEAINYDDYKAENSDDEWVEYTDCLGRTRTCLKKDLVNVKQNDKELRSRVDPNSKAQEENENESDNETVVQDEDISEINDEGEMVSGDMRRELLRRQWEKEEDELRNKSDIHYQDILFGEARTHGTGYYGFSKDEHVRAQQQDALKNLRKETQTQQKLAQEMKRNRDKQLGARIRAAKNRKRARLGLPLLTSDDDEEKPEEPEEPPPAKPELTKEEKLIEKDKEIKRKLHVRPWDLGKEGVKEHYELSQEEWVSLQRKKREQDFAPPRAYHSTHKSIDESSEDGSRGLYFSSNSKKKQFSVDVTKPPPDVRNPSKKHLNPYKSRESVKILPSENFTPTPIRNECLDDDDDDTNDGSEEEVDRLMQDFRQTQGSSKVGAEVPPPPTYDYYGPSSNKKSRSMHPKIDVEDSIMVGLKYLREQAEKKQNN